MRKGCPVRADVGHRGKQPLAAGARPPRRGRQALHMIFLFHLSPKAGKNHIVADFRQIMWRKFLRSLCKDNTMEQPVLPHNVAWPFSAFLPSWCRHLSAAKICGRKRILTLNLASILRKMVLPDNMALSVFSHIFLWTDTQSCRKHVFGRSRHIMWQKWQVRAGETVTFAGVFT